MKLRLLPSLAIILISASFSQAEDEPTPPFMIVGKRYEITFPGGKYVYRISRAAKEPGWYWVAARPDLNGKEKYSWINISQALEVTPFPER